MNTAEIIIFRKDLVQGLRSFEVFAKGKNPPDVVISCQPDLLILRIGGSTIEISGKGCLVGQTRLPAESIKSIRRFLPDTSEIIIGQQDRHLRIGSSLFSCTWEVLEERTIQVPINVSLGDILRISKHYTVDEIDKSGLYPKYEAAMAECKQLTEEALDLLKPLEFTREDLLFLLDEALLRPELDVAKQKRVQRIAKASEILKPLGITYEDLVFLVDKTFIRLKRAKIRNISNP